MATVKIAVTLDENTVRQVDRWVKAKRYPNRSRALQAALDEMSRRDRMERLLKEAEKANPAEEKAMAEEGIGVDPWPEY